MKQKAEEQGEKVPLWIISFADMITLLLSFFVMLQTMAKSQDGTLFGESQESFRRAINGMGLPEILLGRREVVELDYHKLQYPTEEAPEPGPSEPHPRVIDADDETIRRLFDDLKQQMDVQADNEPEATLARMVTPIVFEPGKAALSQKNQDYLLGLATTIQHDLGSRRVSVRVMGMAPDVPDAHAAFLVSAQRASAVLKVLQEKLGVDQTQAAGWTMNAEGAGVGTDLCRQLGLEGKGAQVVIVITESGSSSHGG